MGASRPAGAGGGRREVVAADALEGERVVDRRGEDLGTVEELMIDVQRGTVAYAVVSRPAIPAAGERMFAVPWSALAYDTGLGCFVLEVDPERLERAPGFDRDHWPAMADAAWAAGVHEHYGVRPDWSEAPARPRGAG